jgi:hypothetical protein
MGGYVGKNTNDGLPIKNQVYGISFGLQANLGGSTVSGSSLAGVQTEGTGIQRIPGFGPQYVGRGENLFQSGSVQLFDDVSISRKNFETEWNLKTAKAQQKQITDQLNADLISKQLRTREAYEIYLIQYEKYLGFVDYFRVRELEYKNGYISFLELIKEEDEALLYLEKTLDAYVTFVSHIYELSVLSGLSPIQNDYYSFINTSIDPRWESIIQSFEPKTFEKKLENPGPKQIKETPFYMEKK